MIDDRIMTVIGIVKMLLWFHRPLGMYEWGISIVSILICENWFKLGVAVGPD